MAHRLLLVVSGPPGTGKTTLAEQLGHDLGLPVFCRDTLKEALFDSLGWFDRAWSQRLGAASYACRNGCADESGSIVAGGK